MTSSSVWAGRAFSGFGVATVGLGIVLAAVPATAADKGPPACAAVSFRPVAAGAPDGVQESGLYKSRYAKVVIQAEIQGGAAKNYFMLLNGKKIEGSDKGPKASEGCLKSKHVVVPYKAQPPGACTGEKFRVVIDRSGGKPVAQLFGLHGQTWDSCSSAQM